MNKNIFAIISPKVKFFLGIFLFILLFFSFLFYIQKNKQKPDGLVAPINVNVEIDKIYMNSLVLVTEPHRHIKTLAPTNSTENTLENIIIHTEIRDEYIQGLFFRFPQEQASIIISSIDNVAIFIGNKLTYFDASDITSWDYSIDNGLVDYSVPVDVYKKSIINLWINWHGDLNFILKQILGLITRPHEFIFVYVFILIFILMFYREIYAMLKRYDKYTEIFLLLLLLFFGFLLRINTLTLRYSSNFDELYSAVIASNPSLPVSNIFKDLGNPPFYYFILRIWFHIFGWSETVGRLLSTFMGMVGIVTLYYFVKSLCGKKYAFISAFFLTISFTSVGFSSEMRAYAFMFALVPLVSQMFISILEKINLFNYFTYVICAVLLVNTHLYGILFIMGNFVFYLFYNRYTFERLVLYFTDKQYILERHKFIGFIVANLIIALSFVPYFIITFLNDILLNSSLNNWIPRPSSKEYIYALLFLFAYITVKILLIFAKKNNYFDKNKALIIDYAFSHVVFIYLSSFIISLYKPMFVWRYFSICLPLIIAILPVFIFIIFNIIVAIKPKIISINILGFIASFIFFVFVSNYLSNLKTLGGNAWDVIKQHQQYISTDSKRHPFATQIIPQWGLAAYYDGLNKFYGYTALPFYGSPDSFQFENIVYLTFYASYEDKHLDQELLSYGIDPNNVLKLSYGFCRHLYKIPMKKIEFRILTELLVPKDIEILRQNSYDIISVDVIDVNIVLHCGNIDPQLNILLQSALNRPSGEPFIEITYTNSEAGYLMVHFDYGDGLAGQSNNTGYHRIEVDFEETTAILPIVGWHEGKQLVAIRIDPPDNTVFTIKKVEFLFTDIE